FAVRQVGEVMQPPRALVFAPEQEVVAYLVEAELEGVTIELTPGSSANTFEGTFDVSGLAYGPHDLTVRVYDVLGDAVTAERTVHRYAPPIWRLASHRPNSVVSSANPRIYLQCIGTGPYDCKEFCVYIRSQKRNLGGPGCLGRPVNAPPGPLQFVAVPSYPVQPGEVLTVSLSGRLNVGSEFSQTLGPLYVETSPKLTAVQTAPGAILDFDAARILFIDRQQLGVLDRATQAITWIATLPPDPAGSVPTYGVLTPSGAAVQSATGRVFAWHDGTWRRIASDGRLDAVNGDALVWTTNSDDRGYVHRLSTNTNTSIWNRPGSASPFQSDISASGDVYYGTYEEPWIRRLGVSRLGNHPGNLQRPITDGINVAGRWWNGRVSSSYLFTAGGEEVFLGDSISGNSAGLLLHAGYAGFLRSDGAVNQVWVRTPEGEQHQLSDLATSSLFDQQRLRVGHDGISDDGEVLFLNGGKRYIGRPGAEPEQISSDLGHGRWLDGSFYVTIGNALFQVASAEAGAPPPAASREALRAAAVADLEGYEEVAGAPVVVEALPIDGEALRDAGEAVEPAPAALLDLHEPDALPALSGDEPASDLAGDASSGDVPAALGCSAGGATPPASGVAAFAAAIVGLAFARRGRRRA
ncbi:MAG TPA: hypothetical protein VL242_03750, partial [Sorangium sp.]|nr:hypothetical protein [Sorangium sp.]